MMLRFTALAVLCCLAGGVIAQPATLFDVYAEALEQDPRLRIAQHRLEQGRARADDASGAILPQAQAFAQWSQNEVEFDANELEDRQYGGERYSFQVRQMLFNWSSLSRRAKANQQVAQREAELLDTMSMLLVDVSERYFNVLLADGRVNLTRAEEESVKQQLRQTEKLYERKLVKVTDFLETQARMDRVRTDLIEAENAAALAREELAELTGGPVLDLATIRDDYQLPLLENDLDYWTEQALGNNALLASKREAVLVAEKAVQEQKGGHYPTVDLVYSYQHSDIGYDNQASPERDTEYIGVDFNLPIFSGGSTSARIRDAWSQFYIAREEEEAAQREVLKRTRGAWLTTQSNHKRIESARLSVKSATKSYDAMSKSFSYGTATAADVLIALHTKTRAQRDFQHALYSYLVSWLVLKRESGLLGAEDLRELNEQMIGSSS